MWTIIWIIRFHKLIHKFLCFLIRYFIITFYCSFARHRCDLFSKDIHISHSSFTHKSIKKIHKHLSVIKLWKSRRNSCNLILTTAKLFYFITHFSKHLHILFKYFFLIHIKCKNNRWHNHLCINMLFPDFFHHSLIKNLLMCSMLIHHIKSVLKLYQPVSIKQLAYYSVIILIILIKKLILKH